MKSFSLYLVLLLSLVFTSKAANYWYPEVSGYDKSNSNNGYAGVYGVPVTALTVSGGYKYRVHILNGGWLSEVSGNDTGNDLYGYAGTKNGDTIDAVAISGNVEYAVHVLNGGYWLSPVRKYDINDHINGYAGIIGQAIDAVMINGRTYATAHYTSGSSNGGNTNDNKCKARNGECLPVSSCRTYTVSGLCSGGSNYQCCIKTDDQCKAKGGECLPVSSCRGRTVSGLCSGSSNYQCCITPTKNEQIYKNALSYVGSNNWSVLKARQCAKNDAVYFNTSETKCNLFVYEVLLDSGIDIGTMNELKSLTHPFLVSEGKAKRPACAIDWYNEKVSQFKLIGQGSEGIKNCKPGDIITDGGHMGIVSGSKSTISASAKEFKVVNNDWGFRGDEDRPVRIFRYKY